MSEADKADFRHFQEHISAYDPWGPPLDVLTELYESIEAVTAAPMRDMRVEKVERAVLAATAWISSLEEFMTAVFQQRYRQACDMKETEHSAPFLALPKDIRDGRIQFRAEFEQATNAMASKKYRLWDAIFNTPRRAAHRIDSREIIDDPPFHSPAPPGEPGK